MLIECSAAQSRWRDVSPAAKSLFAASGFVAIFASGKPSNAVLIACLLVLAGLHGARIGLLRYLRLAAPALLFMAPGCLSLALSITLDATTGLPTISIAPGVTEQMLELASRSLGALSALLFLVLTTPLNDLFGLLRRLKAPDVLLDMMILCQRMLFVFSSAAQAIFTAQSARLGYATPRLAMRSLGQLVAGLNQETWLRAQALQTAAQARNNAGPLRFIERQHAHTGRDCLLASLAGSTLIALAVVMR